jgi:hypothetical protein
MMAGQDDLSRKVAELAFRYLAAVSPSQADQIMVELHNLVSGVPGDYYIVFERACDYIAEHHTMYAEPLTLAELLDWLNE